MREVLKVIGYETTKIMTITEEKWTRVKSSDRSCLPNRFPIGFLLRNKGRWLDEKLSQVENKNARNCTTTSEKNKHVFYQISIPQSQLQRRNRMRTPYNKGKWLDERSHQVENVMRNKKA